MIPSGYKEDIVYSAVPTDGSGDLSFTRASNGTRVNSAGLVEVCPWNIVQESETFSNAIWNLYYATITSNSQTAPNGTATADTLNSTTSQYSGIYQSLGTLPTNVYTYSIYVKAGTNNFFYMLGQGNGAQYAFFNLSTGAVGSTASIDSASIESVGNGWYRCQIQKTGAGIEMFIGSSNIQNFTPTANGTVFIWGAQTNIGSTAKPYFPTTDRLNVPRLTYQNGGGGCPSLLLEKQSTNMIFPSNGNNSMAFNGTFTANAILSPEGVSNGFSFLVTSNTNGGLSMVTLATTAQSYTFSAYLKGSVNGQKVLLFGDLNSSIQEFTLTTDWVRYTKTFTGAVGTQSIYLLNGAYLSPAQNNLYYGYGLQLEASSYATSLIKTTSASATRVADACFKTGISSLIGQSQGTLFAEIVRTQSTASDSFWINISDNSSNNWIFMGTDATSGRFYVRASSTTIVDEYPAISLGRHKLAIGYQSGSIVGYVDGVQIFTSSATFTLVSLTGMNFGYSGAGITGAVNTSGQVNQAILFPTRLTNSELASLTTL